MGLPLYIDNLPSRELLNDLSDDSSHHLLVAPISKLSAFFSSRMYIGSTLLCLVAAINEGLSESRKSCRNQCIAISLILFYTIFLS